MAVAVSEEDLPLADEEFASPSSNGYTCDKGGRCIYRPHPHTHCSCGLPRHPGMEYCVWCLRERSGVPLSSAVDTVTFLAAFEQMMSENPHARKPS